MTVHNQAEAARQKVYDDALDQLAAERDGARGQVTDLSIMLSAARAESEARRIALDTITAERDDLAARARECEANHGEDPDPEDPGDETQAQKSVGIQVFPDRQDLSYWDHDGTIAMLAQLGIKKVRGNVGPATTQRTIDFYNRIHDDHVIKSCLTVGKPRDVLTEAEWVKVDKALAKMRGVETLCNWNEPNHNRNGTGIPLDDWQTKTINHGAELTRRYGDDYEIGSAQFWSGNKAKHDEALRSIVAASGTGGTKYADTFQTIVWHLYQRGLERLEQYEATYYGHFGRRPVICSETGMSTAPKQQQGAEAMTEPQQAAFIVDHINMYLQRGHRLYWFELRDEHDPAGTNREDWLGIHRADGTPKPAAHALRQLLAG